RSSDLRLVRCPPRAGGSRDLAGRRARPRRLTLPPQPMRVVKPDGADQVERSDDVDRSEHVGRSEHIDRAELVIRAMRPNDWPAVARIYGEGIATNDATLDGDVPPWPQW